MKIIIIAPGHKMPNYVYEVFAEYQKRFPAHIKLMLQQIPLIKRTNKDNIEKLKLAEAIQIQEKIPKGAYIIALDEKGKQFSSMELADEFNRWQSLGQDIVLIIGGPDGLADSIKAQAQQLWSLSKLTLPHPLVRIFLAETLYRSWSIVANLPYHRE